jgi:choline dehydrogenase-like flavoprotein
MNLVIGSGPAGVAAAQALLARGQRVTMIDAGVTLEPEREAVLARLRHQSPAEFAPADLALVKEGMDARSGGVVLKRVFGSDFPYRVAEAQLGIDAENSALLPSLALGGLSNVWGAAMLPYAQRDLADWPITAQQLAPHYAAVLELTGLAARRDDLAELLPLHTDDPAGLPMSRQATRLWQALERNRDPLRRRGLHFGSARLAVRARRGPDAAGCIACGLCMYGCAYGHIYNSADTVRRWREQQPLFDYLGGVVVERVTETASGVTVHGHRLGSNEPWTMSGDRAFLAAGVLPSTKIVLASQQAYGHPLYIKDSQYFLFPLLQAIGTGDVRNEALYTLSQIFIELTDPAVSPHTVHLQVYSYNDLVGAALKHTLRFLAIDPLVRVLEGRLLVVQGYLHSDHSSRLRAELERGPVLRVTPEIDSAVSRRVRQVVRKLVRHAPALRALAMEPLLQIAPPGRGFHSGGTLPMRAHPEPFESDTLGRPHGWQRLHVVDSSILPTIPATTITYSVMANAHRIATAAGA